MSQMTVSSRYMMWHDLETTMQIFVASRFSMCEHVRAKKYFQSLSSQKPTYRVEETA